RDKAINSISNEGAMMLGCGTRSIRFRPHLNITINELDQGFEMIDKALSKL
ncbi:MAG: L-lysine 6-transaminase, partial [Candidatus Marinimicrobia bacterium]|nr:L-lysine 6-transaminase [Candidatus Neomarinimicrobiota bacterium]